MLKKGKGFTLIEILVALTIVGLLLLIAYPSFKMSQVNNRIYSSVNQLNTAFALARTEAFRRNDYVSICPSVNLTTCSGTNYATGMIVFRNPNRSGLSNENQIIKVFESWEQGVKGKTTVTGGGGTFTFNGVPNVIAQGNVVVCVRGYESYSLTVTTIGGLNITKNSVDNNC